MTNDQEKSILHNMGAALRGSMPPPDEIRGIRRGRGTARPRWELSVRMDGP
jgi:hypothetical protein